MNFLDSTVYFTSPKVAAFVDEVQQGNAAQVRKALAEGISPNAEGVRGFRPIHFVFTAPSAQVLKLLLEAGADPMARIENGNTPLHFAVRVSNPEFTRLLLGAKADPNAKGENRKPVFREALSSREPEILRALAQAGADINVVWGGSTPLMSAIGMMSWDMAAALLDLHADVAYRDHFGENAMDSFCETVREMTPTATNRKGVVAVQEAFKRRGITLVCETELQKFR